MENENKEYEVIREETKFNQELDYQDLIHFNDYLITKRAKTSIFTRIIGAFITILGIYDIVLSITEKKYDVLNIVLNCIFVLFGIAFMFFMTPLMIKLQKRMIRKKITSEFKPMTMKVIVNDEGIGFEMLKEENKEEVIELETEEEDKEESYISNEHARELEYEENHPEETIVEEINAEEDTTLEENAEHPQETDPSVFTIPWGGITKIDDDGKFMFINMVGYQALLIKKNAYDKIDEVVDYAKEKLEDPKRYVEIK